MGERIDNVRVRNRATTTELTLDEAPPPKPSKAAKRLDGPLMLKEHRRLCEWYFQEREKQALNRYEMSIDHGFYDNEQWQAEDAAEVESRGQVPIVYNETAPMVDWLIGTERRTKVDWNVLPRAEDDVQNAETKKQVLKYLSDVNMTTFHRSRAFADAAKGGIGWLDDGVCNDPSQEPIYSRYEDWRYVLWDSAATDLMLKDGRYLFRWKWTDLDIAEAIFPDRVAELRAGTVSTALLDEEDEDYWYLGQHYQARDQAGEVLGRRAYLSDAGVVGNRRKRVKLIEGWYRMPASCQMCYGDEFDGQEFDPTNDAMVAAKADGRIGLYAQIRMRMYVAIFTEKCMIAHGRSPYKHEQFPLTPIWFYRRGRDRLPYGAIRRVRDIQEDLNKRASKAQFVMSTNQIVAERGAVEDWDEAREEADRPDGVLVHAKGHKFEIRRDAEMGRGHLEIMGLDAQKIQNSAGVNNENLGRQTNAESGEAIKARQLQGAVGTTEPFDNLRMAIQVQGQKTLSLAEQYMTAPKVIRLTGHRGRIEWTKVNQPELQPDGSVRWLNDLTASSADFIVSEQDFHGSLRQAMFETMMQMVSRAGITPELAIKLLRMAFEFSDFPNKDEIVADLRAMSGEPDPNKRMTPEEEQAQAALKAQQEALMKQQQEAATLALEEQRANVRLANAKAEQIIRDVSAQPDGGAGNDARQIEDAVRQVQAQADQKLMAMSEKMVRLQAEVANKVAAIGQEADSAATVARIEADAKVRIAEIEKDASAGMDAFMARLEELSDQIAELADRSEPEAPEPKEKGEGGEKPAAVFGEGAIQVSVGSGAGKRTVRIKGPSGQVYEGSISEDEDEMKKGST